MNPKTWNETTTTTSWIIFFIMQAMLAMERAKETDIYVCYRGCVFEKVFHQRCHNVQKQRKSAGLNLYMKFSAPIWCSLQRKMTGIYIYVCVCCIGLQVTTPCPPVDGDHHPVLTVLVGPSIVPVLVLHFSSKLR
jgi:hypothetical protein